MEKETLRKDIKKRIEQDLTYEVTNFIMEKVIRSSFEYFVAAKTKEHQGEYKKLGYIDEDIEEHYWDEFRELWCERNGVYPEGY
jgi:ribosomal protein S18 acetylase RimI-like enzyme